MVKSFAHRGFSGPHPENTMLAFEKALETRAEGIELDVHLTADGRLAVIHDETVDRTTGGTGFVGRMTMARLAALDASKPRPGAPRQGVPALEEVFELVEGTDVIVNIELKTGIIWYEGIEEAVLALAERFGLRRRILISSFNHFSALKFAALAPDVPVAFLEESRLIDPLGYLQKHGLSCYHPMAACMAPDVLEPLKRAGVTVNVWTVDEEDDMRRLIAAGVDGIITNYPDRLDRVRAEAR